MAIKRPIKSRVSAAVYAKHLERLGLTQEGAAKLFGGGGRTGQRWAAEGAPLPVVMIMSLYDTAEEIEALALEVSKSK
jgi:heme oxygenase